MRRERTRSTCVTNDDDVQVITPGLLRAWPMPTPSEGKESRGHVVVVAGTTRTPGAAVLAAEAALRAGAGKLTVATTATTAAHVATAVPESLVEPLPEDRDGHLGEAAGDVVAGLADQAEALLIGPGLLDDAATYAMMRALAQRITAPVVVDATATGFLRQEPDAFRHLGRRVVLTANPKEMASVAGCDISDVEAEPLPVALQVARRCEVVVLLGGTAKQIAAPDKASWTYAGGGPGLGVSGSGDVQAGIVAGLLARGAEADQAAVWGAFVHARVGERLAADTGVLGHLAREQTVHVPLVLRELDGVR
jgi:ADP-dependent NAD(P)H-hydrate dehydratase